MSKQSGQTLIETIVAIFILITSLTSGLALTIYVLSNSQRGLNQVIATNLAREGIDAVRNMRDTNWLESDHVGGTWGLTVCDIGGGPSFYCYPRAWEGVLGVGYHNYDLTIDGSFRADYSNTTNSWSLVSSSTYTLYLQSDGSYTHVPSSQPTPFARKIVISRNTAAPYSTGSMAQLIVTAIVGWSGKGCSVMTGSDPATTNCNTTVTERLTNWKDYR